MNNGYWTLWKCLLGRIFKPEDFFFKKIKIWCCRVTSRGPKKRSASEGWLRDRLGQIDSFESLDGQWGLMVLSSFLDSSFQWPPSCAPSGEEVRAVGKGLELGKSCDLKWTAYIYFSAGGMSLGVLQEKVKLWVLSKSPLSVSGKCLSSVLPCLFSAPSLTRLWLQYLARC